MGRLLRTGTRMSLPPFTDRLRATAQVSERKPSVSRLPPRSPCRRHPRRQPGVWAVPQSPNVHPTHHAPSHPFCPPLPTPGGAAAVECAREAPLSTADNNPPQPQHSRQPPCSTHQVQGNPTIHHSGASRTHSIAPQAGPGVVRPQTSEPLPASNLTWTSELHAPKSRRDRKTTIPKKLSASPSLPHRPMTRDLRLKISQTVPMLALLQIHLRHHHGAPFFSLGKDPAIVPKHG